MKTQSKLGAREESVTLPVLGTGLPASTEAPPQPLRLARDLVWFDKKATRLTRRGNPCDKNGVTLFRFFTRNGCKLKAPKTDMHTFLHNWIPPPEVPDFPSARLGQHMPARSGRPITVRTTSQDPSSL